MICIKNAFVFLLAVALTGAPLHGAGLVISTEPVITSVRVHEPIEVTILITNTGKEVREFYGDDDLAADLLIERSRLAQAPEKSSAFRSMFSTGPDADNSRTVSLQPQATYRQKILITDWFDFETVGSEKVRISWPREGTSTELDVAISARDEQKLLSRARELLKAVQSGPYPESEDALRLLGAFRDNALVPMWEAMVNDKRSGRSPLYRDTAIYALRETETPESATVLGRIASVPTKNFGDPPDLARKALLRMRAKTKRDDVKDAVNKILGPPTQ